MVSGSIMQNKKGLSCLHSITDSLKALISDKKDVNLYTLYPNSHYKHCHMNKNGNSAIKLVAKIEKTSQKDSPAFQIIVQSRP
jgi:hypothetical protein